MLRSIKPPKCKHCKKAIDVPHHVLHDACVQPWIEKHQAKRHAESAKAHRAAAKVERAEIRARREKLKRIPDLIREAQVVFNRWIRERDHDKPCISCGAPPPDLSQLHAGRDAGHYRSTGSASHLRFNPDNCHAQCVRCNRYGAGMAVDYRIRLIARIGAAEVEALEADNTPHKWEREELTATRAKYKAKLKQHKASL